MIGSVTAVLDDWPVLVRLVDSSIDYFILLYILRLQGYRVTG